MRDKLIGSLASKRKNTAHSLEFRIDTNRDGSVSRVIYTLFFYNNSPVVKINWVSNGYSMSSPKKRKRSSAFGPNAIAHA
ncbi:MAG: hypothetical protein JWL63_2681 [Rhodocyclales bacterium]|nr:hypothetical protein [Rhodocyclales bacterium]